MSRGGKALDRRLETALVGRYRVQSMIGSGGMAVVYRAEDTVLGRLVALKTLRDRYAEDPIYRIRFRQEARAMALLDHENIVRIYDIYRDGQLPFIVAEYVDGNDVGTLIEKRGRLSELLALSIAEQVLRALSYAHRRGIVHRDIKPSNILNTWDGTVKVADFGIARMLEDEEASETGEIVGSARYMSPEQLAGKEVTPQSDIYSVGILLYHCLTGEPPFAGDLKSLVKSQIHEAPRPPRELNKKISPRVEAVILKALSKDPKDRYSSADAMLDALQGNKPGPLGKRATNGKKLLVAAALALLVVFGGGASLAAGLGHVGSDSGKSEKAAASSGAVKSPKGKAPEAPAKHPQGSGKEQASEQQKNTSTAGKKSVSKDTSNYVVVPNVREFFDYSAENILARRGFRVRFVYDQHPGYANRGVTWATDPAMGTLAPPGSTVTIYATPKLRPQPQS